MREKIENDIKMANKLAKTVEKVAARIRGQQGENRQRAAEICASVTTSQMDKISAMTQEEKIGKALLKKLEAEGLQIPTSNAVKNKKKKAKAARAAAAGDRAQHAQADQDRSQKNILKKDTTMPATN
jgi:hypothetical protein